MSLREKLNWSAPQVLPKTHPLHKWIVLVVTILFMIQTMSAVVPTAIAEMTIRGALKYGDTQALWITIVYILVRSFVILISTRIAEQYGYKKVYFLSSAIFLLGATCSGLSWNFTSLLICRIIEGIGGGGVINLGMAIVARLFFGKQLTLASSLYVGVGWGLGFTIGALTGGYFGVYGPWQAIFYFSLVFGIPALILTWLFFFELEKKKQPPLDVVGLVSFFCFFTAGMLILTCAKADWNAKGWTSNFIKLWYGVGLVSLIVFVIRELRCKYPVIDFSLFKIRAFSVGSAAIFFLAAPLFISLANYPGVIEQGYQWNALNTAMLFVPTYLIMGVGGAITGVISKKIDVRLLSVVGIILVVLSCYFGKYLTIQNSRFQIGSLLLLRGAGLALCFGPLTAISLYRVPKEKLASAVAMNTFLRQAGLSYGSGVVSIIMMVRTIYHEQRYMTQMGAQSTPFINIFNQIKSHLINKLGVDPVYATQQTKGILVTNVKLQAIISAMNDVFLVLGGILFLFLIYFAYSLIRYYLRVYQGRLTK